ncbi:MAG TPA: DivIVA domain-containing protein, partial [Acidothermaceae bacterium]
MLPILLGVLVSVAVIFAVFAVTLGRGGSMTQFQPDWPGRPLPDDRTVRAADVGTAKFSLAFRGYRMAEVDDALDRIAAEIAERDDAILRLSGRSFESQRMPLAPAAVPTEALSDRQLSDDTAPVGLTPIAPEAPAPVGAAPVDDTAAIYMRPPAPAADDTAPFPLPP